MSWTKMIGKKNTGGKLLGIRDGIDAKHGKMNIALITSYFNFANRIALLLRVQSTAEEAKSYKV